MYNDTAYDTRANNVTLDQSIIYNGLKDISNTQDAVPSQTLWGLAKTALISFKQLQEELHQAKYLLAQKEQRINELEALVTTDELTSLTNRRGFYDAFDREMDRVNRGQNAGGVIIMIDLDNFKTINDTYGHHAGDEALRLVAQTLDAHIRKMDTAARMGGDEFILLFSNCCKIKNAERVQKLARKLNRLILKHDGHRIPIRASLGIQEFAKGDRLETVIGNADTKMYEAKEARR